MLEFIAFLANISVYELQKIFATIMFALVSVSTFYLLQVINKIVEELNLNLRHI